MFTVKVIIDHILRRGNTHDSTKQAHINKTRLAKKLKSGPIDWSAQLPDEPEEEEESFDIIRTKRFSLKPMSPEEAVLQMNLLGHEFFAFINQDDGSFSVVYRRKMGDYGLISADDTPQQAK